MRTISDLGYEVAGKGGRMWSLSTRSCWLLETGEQLSLQDGVVYLDEYDLAVGETLAGG